MMRLVLDTSVLVSYLFWKDSPVREVVRNALHYSKILRSTETFAELSEVVMRPKFDSYLSTVERELFLASYYDTSRHVLITERINACRDPKDNKFLELAVCGQAAIILTGDKDLLALDPFHEIRILTPSNLNI